MLKFRLNNLETAVKAAVDLIFAVYEQLTGVQPLNVLDEII